MRRYWIVIMDLNITVANPNSNCELEKKKQIHKEPLREPQY